MQNEKGDLKMIRRMTVALFVAALCALPGTSFAVVLGTEDPTNGFIGVLGGAVPPSPSITVGSDGEVNTTLLANWSAAFPGIGVDVSDAIKFTAGANWALAPGVTGWVALPLAGDGSRIWYLPANLTGIGCGNENETTCEPVGIWNFLPGISWLPGTDPNQIILDPNGTISDIINLLNTGPGGAAQVRFASDPILIPEPGTLALLTCGILGMSMAWCLRRGKKA